MAKKKAKKLAVGDRVYFTVGFRRILGTIVADRGNIGVGRRRIVEVHAVDPSEDVIIELPEELLTAASTRPMPKKKRKAKRLAVGDRVYFQYVRRRVLGTIVGDRGNLGGGARILAVHVQTEASLDSEAEDYVVELPEEELTRAPISSARRRKARRSVA